MPYSPAYITVLLVHDDSSKIVVIEKHISAFSKMGQRMPTIEEPTLLYVRGYAG